MEFYNDHRPSFSAAVDVSDEWGSQCSAAGLFELDNSDQYHDLLSSGIDEFKLREHGDRTDLVGRYVGLN